MTAEKCASLKVGDIFRVYVDDILGGYTETAVVLEATETEIKTKIMGWPVTYAKEYMIDNGKFR